MNQLNLTNIKNSFVFLLYLIALLSCENESSYIAVTNVTLNTTHVNLAEGEEYMLTATISPYNATNKNLIWVSSNASVADVIDGKIIARKRGEAIITVQTDDDTKTATCSVTVTERNDDTTGGGSDPDAPEQPGKPDDQETYEYKYDPSNLSYTIDGKSFKMIYVEGTGDINSFYIMQTEVLPGSDFKIGNDSVGILDADENDVVSGNELMEFFRNIWRTTYIPFRLPTYKEWLYAAKGGHKSKNYKYSGSNSIDEVAWYAANSYSMSQDVAQKAPNELGLYDMSGNYEEITGDLNMYFHLDTWNPLKTDYEMTNTCVYIDGDTYGGTWKDNASSCTVTSWKEGDSNGALSNQILDKNGKWLSNKNHVDARYITIRLVYSLE